MLKELTIENLAVIEKASVTFGERLNVFTGETGAGKSILIGGINAILGGRVNKDIVRKGADKAVIIGLFDDIPQSVNAVLTENGYPECDELLVQREISADGKSTARINGRTVTAAILRDVTVGLINIHGQHDNQLLMNPDNQRDILDRYAGNGELLEQYKAAFKEFSAVSRQIKEHTRKIQNEQEKAEILRDRLSELDKYSFSPDEEATITEQLNSLRNAEFLQKNLYRAVTAISGDDENEGAYSLLEQASQSINNVTEAAPDISALSDRISNLLLELEDIRNSLSAFFPDDDDNEGKLAYCEERLSAILSIQRRFAMPLPELLRKAEEWRDELYTFDNSEDISELLNEKKHECAEKVKNLASKLTAERKKAAKLLAERISEQLTFLDMPDIRLIFDVSQDKVTMNGMDTVEILISVNKGEDLKPMSKIASGGELSRIMLAVKNVLADTDNINTMIFDEIDTGISGRAAQKVAVKLREAAQCRQILCVTHLAQIAAAADTHLLIRKSSDSERTYTEITSLGFDGRKREIARIISGDENSEVSLKNAEELISAVK